MSNFEVTSLIISGTYKIAESLMTRSIIILPLMPPSEKEGSENIALDEVVDIKVRDYATNDLIDIGRAEVISKKRIRIRDLEVHDLIQMPDQITTLKEFMKFSAYKKTDQLLTLISIKRLDYSLAPLIKYCSKRKSGNSSNTPPPKNTNEPNTESP